MTQVFEGIAIALSSLWANKTRATLTILGVAVGVSVVMIIASILTGFNSAVASEVESFGPRTFLVMRRFEGGIRINGDRDRAPRPQFTLAEMQRIRNLPHIAFVIQNLGRSTRVEYGNQSLGAVTITGSSPEWNLTGGGEITVGRNYTRVENGTSSRVIVINEPLADELFGLSDPLGRTIRVAGMPYRVIGVYAQPPQLFDGDPRPNGRIPLSVFGKDITSLRNESQVEVAPTADISVEDAIEEVTVALRAMRGLKPGEDNNFDVVTQDRLLQTFRDTTLVVYIIMIALSSVGLMVGGVGVIAIMMISVTERTREIGVRKALGARRVEILWQFLVEAATVTLVGGAVGMMLGGSISAIVAAVTPVPAEVPLWSVVVALGASVVTGIVFGLYPAAKAARLDPVEALRYE